MTERARLSFQPRLMKAHYAAAYLGVSETKFREWVKAGDAPSPRQKGDNVLWDVRDLDAFADSLPRRGEPANDDWLGAAL